MKIKKGTLPRFAKLCLYCGAFTVLALASFSMVYFFTTPEVERFVSAFKADALYSWASQTFVGWDNLWPSLMFLLATIGASFVGFVSAIIAKVLNDRAEAALKAGIGS